MLVALMILAALAGTGPTPEALLRAVSGLRPERAEPAVIRSESETERSGCRLSWPRRPGEIPRCPRT